MELFFSPLACSLAVRISIYELGLDDRTTFCQVDLREKRLVADGADYLAVNPAGLAPALRTEDGHVLTETSAILVWLADRFPQRGLAPSKEAERYELLRWLSFVSAELHKVVFAPLLSPMANPGVREFARGCAVRRLDLINGHLTDRAYILDRFSIADAYLAAVLNWSAFVQIDLAAYPSLSTYFQRVAARPSIARAIQEETTLFRAGQET